MFSATEEYRVCGAGVRLAGGAEGEREAGDDLQGLQRQARRHHRLVQEQRGPRK